jgi:hypothetical protein
MRLPGISTKVFQNFLITFQQHSAYYRNLCCGKSSLPCTSLESEVRKKL